MKFVCWIFLLFSCIPSLFADTLHVDTHLWGVDDRFYKYEVTLPVFQVQGDTIRTLTFEHLIPAKEIVIKKIPGYTVYGYSFIFFPGAKDSINPGYTALLICNPYARNPKMALDINHNYDFTDDPVFRMPYFNEPGIETELSNSLIPEGKNKVHLTRNNLFSKADYRKYMNEYYEYFYKDRKFCGMDYSYRIQQYIVKTGTVKIGNDSFRIGLYDANKNGLFNDADTDKVMLIEWNDSIYDATTDIGSCLVQKSGKPMFLEKNGWVLSIVNIDAAGQSITLNPLSQSDPASWKFKPGKRLPNVSFTLADGRKMRLRKLRKQPIYIYCSDLNNPRLEKDTAELHRLSNSDSTKIRVLIFLFVQKSYELRMFANQSHAPYLVALGNKELARKLGIKGLPQTILTKKRRRLIAYHASFEDAFQWIR